MDQRSNLRHGHFVLGFVLLAVVTIAAGCSSAFATAVWLIKGPDMPAEFGGLREKRVVVVCRPTSNSLYAHPGVVKDVSRQISGLLRKHVRKIEVVDSQKVDEWIDTNTWDEYLEIGKALEADLVLGVDLEYFSIYQGQTLFKGKADFAVSVTDCKTGEVVFECHPPQSVYPPNASIPTQDRQESDFRREFVTVLSDEIARHFYPHDPHAYWAMDATTIH